MKLTKKSDQVLPEQNHVSDATCDTESNMTRSASKPGSGLSMDRRTFLRNSGLVAGGATLATMLVPGMMKKAKAASAGASQSGAQQVKTICTHCSVGCGIIAEVQSGVWTGQEPAFDHPFNQHPDSRRRTRPAAWRG